MMNDALEPPAALPPLPAPTTQPAAGSGTYGVPEASDYEITVADPVKQGDGVGAYVSYKVVARNKRQGARSEVIRRFRDFVWLQQRLRSQYRGTIVPALPEKNVVEKYKMNADFIEQRRAALTVFVNRVASHPLLRTSKELQLFLEASETEFAIEVSRTQVESSSINGGSSGSSKKTTLNGAVQFFKDLGHSATSLVQRRTDDEEEDPEYLKVRSYIFELEKHLGEAHRQASRLVRHQAELGGAVQEFGTAMTTLGRFEEASGVADTLSQLGEKADCISRLFRETSDTLGKSFEAPLKEFVRTVKAVKKVVADRSAALVAFQQARGEVDSRRTKLAKLRGTPGIKEEKVAEAERDLNDAQHKADAAKQAYEGIVQQMSAELVRFQRERSQEMAYVLRDFAVAQAQVSSDSARLWRSMIPGLAQADTQ